MRALTLLITILCEFSSILCEMFFKTFVSSSCILTI